MFFRAPLLACLSAAFQILVQSRSQKKHFEVERKFRISLAEADALPLRLRELGFKPAGTVTMTDSFLPVKNKGEMMRVRDEDSGGNFHSFATFKRWVIAENGEREREEAEAEIGPFARAFILILGRMVKGQRLLSFSKERTHYERENNNAFVVATIDKVSGLGAYSGTYLEIESIVPLDEDTKAAKEGIFVLAKELFGIPRNDVQNSYFEMLELSLRENLSA
ncbi:MAG: CYTH domain-containing protein [Candidatus Obscuribacterales bacterium]|nr:CYTH domain-containing protein [Candidatus Obscuribacterales bacterium]